MGFTSKYTGAQIEGYLDAVAEINSVIESNEKVTAAAFNDVNARIKSLAESIVNTINADF